MLFEHSRFGELEPSSTNDHMLDFGPTSESFHHEEGVLADESAYREKRIQHAADVEELIRALGGLNLEKDYWISTAQQVKSVDPTQRYEGTKRFRMMSTLR